MKRILQAVLAVVLAGWATDSLADTTINETNAYAYGANIGWIDARGDETNGAVIGRFACSGYLYGANVGWIHLGSGSPTNGYSYGNAATNDYGVNHDGLGALRGLAWGANIGWISFESIGDPQVDLVTGNLSGYAYGANVGWISLSNAEAFVQTDMLDPGPDTDGDGIPDMWEMREAGDLGTLSGGDHDEDEDGSSDVVEYGADTDPLDDASLLEITVQDANSLTNRLTWTVEDTRFYTVLECTNLVTGTNWTDCGLGLMVPDPGGSMTRDVTVPTGIVVRAYGVRASVPLE